MSTSFDGFDLGSFWEVSDYAREHYQDEPPTEELVRDVERELGYRLPRAFIELAQHQNGGIPVKQNHRTSEPTTWDDDGIAIAGIFSTGRTKRYSLCGPFGSRFWVDEWEYPPIGVYFANTPTAGHDMVALDYRECGPEGEPRVVHVAQGDEFEITFVAEDFASFIRGLQDDDEYEAGG
jgi:hypothetical protein